LFACLRSARLAEAIDAIARDFSPRIQRYGADAVVLDVSGLGRLLGPPQTIGEELARACWEKVPRSSAFRIAIAPSQTTALMLTLSDAALTVVTADESTALAALPLRCLQQHVAAAEGTAVFRGNRAKEIEDQFAVLRRWGLSTLGDLAALPAADLSARMGQAGLALQQLARGRDPGPLVPDPGVTRFIERIELEWPIDALEPLSFVLARLLDPLSSALERAGRAAAAIRLHLRLVDRTTHERVLQLPAAMRDPRVLRTLLLLDLESHAPSAAVDVVTIEADPAPGRVIQYSLLERALPSPETLATLMARLGALVGESRCGSPHIPDTHRPDAFEILRFAPSSGATSSRAPELPNSRASASARPSASQPVTPAIRLFRPPVAVRVTVDRGRPVHLAIDRRGMPGGAIVQAAGPWRTSGAWWVERGAGEAGEHKETTSWDRDEWDVELADGSVCRLFHDRPSAVWFLDGIFD
jgi:protein ImuB